MDPTAAKRRLRREMRSRKPAPTAEVAAVGERVCARLLAEPAFARAPRVALYAALPDEVPTVALFAALRSLGRPCLFPRMLADGRLAFVRVDSLADLHPGRHGVAEPRATEDETLGEEDVVVVPGMAFDRSGNRLGRGGGYYDRTFPASGLRPPRLIGVIHADRLLESVPRDSHDRAMDAIVTEREFFWIRRAR